MGRIVSLVRNSSDLSVGNLKLDIEEALDLINFRMPNSVQNIAIKPNLAYYWDAATGYTTDPRLVAALVDYCRDRCGNDIDIRIVESDASAMRTKYAFPVLGYDKLAKEKRISLFNLSSDTLQERAIKTNDVELKFMIPESLIKTDLFINVPKMKIMRQTRITCAMKNIFGCMGFRRKIVYHTHLDEAIVGMNKILHPNVNIVDSLVALGRFPIKLGLIIASDDTFSIDWVVAQMAGYNPKRVGFLKIAIDEKLGCPHGIKTVGVDPREISKVFPKSNFASSEGWWNMQFALLKAYSKIVGDILPPFIEDS